MANSLELMLSVVVPLYNEGAGIDSFHVTLTTTLEQSDLRSYEIIYCDDGSSDQTGQRVDALSKQDKHVKLLRLSRNFGKENALSAGIAHARGQAVIMVDGDGQHPVELIPDFIQKWKNGAQVVIGVSANHKQSNTIKRWEAILFYKLFNTLTGQKLLAGSTDFRLIDRVVREEFLRLNESDRIIRGLIDWLGFKREFVYFNTKPRVAGEAGYSQRKLLGLAANSFVSLSPMPLYIFGYLGVAITAAAFLGGAAVFIEQLLLSDPWHWRFTGTAMLGILILFLVGVILMSQGILSLYISHIHSQSKQRPLYVVDYGRSTGFVKTSHDK